MTQAADAPHAPRRGPLAHRLGALHVTGVFWYRLFAAGVRVIPERLLPLLVPPLTSVTTPFLRGIVRALADNLDAVSGPAPPRERRRRVRATLHAFAWCLTERYERLCTGRRFEVTLENESAWHAVARSDRGFVVATAHVGQWEAGSMLPVTEAGLRVHVVREGEIDPRAQRLLEGLLARRFAGTSYVTHFASGDPGLGVELLEALRRGEVVAVQADRPRAGGQTVPATMFGRSFPLPLGPLALARAAGVPILPAFTLREGRRRYRVVFGTPVEVERTARRRDDLQAAAARLAFEVERIIRRRPEQWFCFAPVWR